MSKPACTSARHRFVRDASKGVAENPGVWSNGGTHVATSYVCAHCGVTKTEHTDIVTRRTKVKYASEAA